MIWARELTGGRCDDCTSGLAVLELTSPMMPERKLCQPCLDAWERHRAELREAARRPWSPAPPVADLTRPVQVGAATAVAEGARLP